MSSASISALLDSIECGELAVDDAIERLREPAKLEPIGSDRLNLRPRWLKFHIVDEGRQVIKISLPFFLASMLLGFAELTVLVAGRYIDFAEYAPAEVNLEPENIAGILKAVRKASRGTGVFVDAGDNVVEISVS